MALVVESYSNATANNANSVTVTKPTGVVSGDLLIIAASKGSYTTFPTCTGFTLGLSKGQNNSGSIPDVGVVLLYRIADASDVSASNYSVAFGSFGEGGSVTMLRVSGWTSGNPFYTSASHGGNMDAASGTTSQTGLSLVVPANQLLIAVYGFYSNNSPVSTSSTSGYTVTSADSNPSWTELYDINATTDTSTARLGFSIAYAYRTVTSNITGYSIDIASDTGGTEDGFCSLLGVIVQPTSATGTNTLHSVSPTIFTNAGAEAGTIGTNTLHEATPELFEQSGRGIASTQWTAETKPSTSWNKET